MLVIVCHIEVCEFLLELVAGEEFVNESLCEKVFREIELEIVQHVVEGFHADASVLGDECGPALPDRTDHGLVLLHVLLA